MTVYFTPLDWTLFVSVLLISVLVGIYYGVRERLTPAANGVDQFLMGGRQLPLVPVALSLFVSFQSAILVLGTPADIFYHGITYWCSFIGISLAAAFTCYIFVPVFYHLQLTTVYEYLEARFRSRTVRRIGAALYVLVTVIYMSLSMYAPAVALAAVMRIMSLEAFIVIAGVLCSFYVGVGGMKAVIWTDALQAFVMLVGLLAVIIQGTIEIGGIDEVWRINRKHGRLDFFDWNLDPFARMTTLGIVIGQCVSWLGWYGINQSAVQRYCGMRTSRQGQIALLANIPALFISLSLVAYCALVMFAYFVDCDPLAAGELTSSNEMVPYFVAKVVSTTPGMIGLFIASLFAGTMSTVSSGLNSVAAVIYNDFLFDRTRDWSEDKIKMLTKLLCVMFGVICTGVAFLGPYVGKLLNAAMKMLGSVNGPLTGLFLLGVLFPWANERGAFLGALISTTIMLAICTGSVVLGPVDRPLPTSTDQCDRYDIDIVNNTQQSIALYRDELNGILRIFALSSTLYDLFGVLLVFLIAVPFSFITGFTKLSSIDGRLLHPIYRRLGARKILSSPTKTTVAIELDDAPTTTSDAR